MLQKNLFLNGEGDKWFNRNWSKLSEKPLNKDPIIKLIVKKKLSLKNTLEIGCSNGYRLNYLKQLKKRFNFFGIDPSKKAINEGKKIFKNISLERGTADNLPFHDNYFDLIIFGFCLYLCDRSHLFKIIYDADRVLKSGGVIIIHDFYSTIPYSNNYKHLKKIKSYKMDYSKLFTHHPSYKLLYRNIYPYDKSIKVSKDNRLGLFAIKKF